MFFEAKLVERPKIKRYFVTKELTTDLPYEFINSTNKRYIHVVSCKLVHIDPATNQTTIPQHVTLHANFVNDKKYVDSYVRSVNQPYLKRDKYEQLDKNEQVTVWFKYINGVDIDMTNMHFILKLMLEY